VRRTACRTVFVRLGNGILMNILDNGIHLAQTMPYDELDGCLDLITLTAPRL
jgi:cytosine deaminase